MYDRDDPRARLGGGKPSNTQSSSGGFAPAQFGLFYETEPQIVEDGARTWLTRGQNFLVAYSELEEGATLERRGQADEYMALLPDREAGAVIEADGERIEAEGYSLVIAPPGDSRMTMRKAGRLVRVFSTQSEDLCALCSNAASYVARRDNIPPFAPWPAPADGYRIRVYGLDVPKQPGRFGRIFRCSTMMLNVLDDQLGPRDIEKLSPHHHDDFEQGSLALAGSFTHHLRWPWTVNMNHWREDQHALCNSPSLTVIPPPAIHTSRGMDAGLNQLVDIFSPPREDFSLQEGWVLNAQEYPMPKREA